MWQLDWNKLAEVLTYNAKQPMIFSSGLFLFLFLGFSLIYVLLQKKDTARILFVSLFSYYFYYKSSGFYFFLLGVVTVTDFFLAGRMAVTESKWGRKGLLLLSLFVNLGLLCYFKYTNFFYEMLTPLWNGNFEPLDIFLPVRKMHGSNCANVMISTLFILPPTGSIMPKWVFMPWNTASTLPSKFRLL